MPARRTVNVIVGVALPALVIVTAFMARGTFLPAIVDGGSGSSGGAPAGDSMGWCCVDYGSPCMSMSLQQCLPEEGSSNVAFRHGAGDADGRWCSEFACGVRFSSSSTSAAASSSRSSARSSVRPVSVCKPQGTACASGGQCCTGICDAEIRKCVGQIYPPGAPRPGQCRGLGALCSAVLTCCSSGEQPLQCITNPVTKQSRCGFEGGRLPPPSMPPTLSDCIKCYTMTVEKISDCGVLKPYCMPYSENIREPRCKPVPGCSEGQEAVSGGRFAAGARGTGEQGAPPAGLGSGGAGIAGDTSGLETGGARPMAPGAPVTPGTMVSATSGTSGKSASQSSAKRIGLQPIAAGASANAVPDKPHWACPRFVGASPSCIDAASVSDVSVYLFAPVSDIDRAACDADCAAKQDRVVCYMRSTDACVEIGLSECEREWSDSNNGFPQFATVAMCERVRGVLGFDSPFSS